MEMDSPDKNMEEINEEDVHPTMEKPGPDFVSKDELRYDDEELNNGMQIYSNQEYPDSHMLPDDVNDEELPSSIMKSKPADSSSSLKISEDDCLQIQSDLDHNDVDRGVFDYNTEERRSPTEDYQHHPRKQGDEGADYADLPGELPDDDGNGNLTFCNELHTENSHPGVCDPLLTVHNNNNSYEIMNTESFNQNANSPTYQETMNRSDKNGPENSPPEKDEVDEYMGGGNMIRHTEMKEDYSSEMVSSEKVGMVQENSVLHSPERTAHSSPSPERRFSVSAERSPHTKLSPNTEPFPHTHPSPKLEERASPANSEKRPAHSPKSSRRRYSPSPEKRNVDRKRPSSRDRASPSVRQKSPSGRTAQRDSHRRDNSPRRHSPVSPRRRDSPRRKGRSRSRSPVRRRDSPGHGRDHHRRSRSRSPHARDRSRRSPRRRQSPRRRSPPPYHSRRRSPKRPWSPPANRSTGLGRPGNNLFVAGFSYVTTERDLEKKFSRFGRVKDVRIVRDRRSGESRGFGFLSLERDEDADAAIRALDQTEWNGRIVLVEKSKTSTR